MSENNGLEEKALPVRVVIDTGVWVSFLIGKVLKKLGDYLKKESIEILFSDELFEELFEVLHRPKIKKYIKEDQVFEIIGIIFHKAEWVEITSTTEICRDEKDNFLLDLAKSGHADYLITGDEDLLTIKNFEGTEIINFREFQTIFL